MYRNNTSNNEKSELLDKIRELEFAALELNLFLDNFPQNQQALTSYNNFTLDLNKLKDEYENTFGPLANFGSSQSKLPWSWIDDPWPWEIGE